MGIDSHDDHLVGMKDLSDHWREIRELYAELRNERWTCVDAAFWYLLGILTCAIIAWMGR